MHEWILPAISLSFHANGLLASCILPALLLAPRLSLLPCDCLQYALAYEGELPGCTKRWVINKIVNATERALLIDSLLEAGFSMDDIIIRWFNATKVRNASSSSNQQGGPLLVGRCLPIVVLASFT